MLDVASTAGVSLKTVSRVVNGGVGVRPETEARVRDAIATLGYQENELARTLRSGQPSPTWGLIIEDLANPFYSAIARAVEKEAACSGYMLIAGSSDEDPARERELTATLLKRRVGGLLLVPAGRDHRYLLPELSRGTAVVFLDRPPGGIAADAVVLDNVGGAEQAVRHMISHGHRRIGVVGDPPEIYTIAERLKGYRRALASAGIPHDPQLVRMGNREVEEAESAARAMLALADPPTALFATNNRASIGAVRAMGDGAGAGVALVGFDDFELADMLPTPVTVIRHNPSEMGRRGAQLLQDRLAGSTAPPQLALLPTELVARGSGEVPAS